MAIKNYYRHYKLEPIKENLDLTKRYKFDTLIANEVILFLESKLHRMRISNMNKKEYNISTIKQILENNKAVMEYNTAKGIKTIEIDRVDNNIVKQSLYTNNKITETKYYKLNKRRWYFFGKN